jgi:predicted RNA polymerase sigma factor
VTEAGAHADASGDAPGPADIGELLRELAPQVLGTLMRRYGEFGECEDAVQEALLKAVTAWPERGVPQTLRAGCSLSPPAA